MEKLEKHIKNKLESRKITPSPEAWERVSSQLNTAPVATTSKRKYIYAIAAGFVGLLLASVFFFASDSTQEPAQVVDENNVEDHIVPSVKEKLDFGKENNVEPILVESTTEDGKHEDLENRVDLESSQFNEVEIASKKSFDKDVIKEDDPLITQKVNEVMAQVALLEAVNTEVTDAEVDSLLRAAQKEILTEKVFLENGSVDAMALLTEVEDELDASFRDQIFDALKEGYFKLRTAVADRNN